MGFNTSDVDFSYPEESISILRWVSATLIWDLMTLSTLIRFGFQHAFFWVLALLSWVSFNTSDVAAPLLLVSAPLLLVSAPML
jgi:hypothetical protein